ncbi:E3 ubiquitin-protein ligase mib1-like [Daphnia pulicaria]|uniref:E3 ubiquitin-protein ligase mib1-like n=1 Tax=Daphnia pulicaria TaxID=35523 RepID=UPI001EEA076D|nr:E3 ubiquitin-protein ligase mib1-like [Daphnia pulicaria]
MDLGIVKAGIGGHYQPDTLPVLVISKPRANEKTNDVVADPPFVVGDRVKVVVGLKQLREMSVNCELNWMNSEMERLVNEILIIEELKMETLNHDKTVKVVSSKWKNNGIWLPVKALRRSIPWLPVGAAVQVIDQSLSSDIDMAHNVTFGDFGRVKQVNLDGETVDMDFFKSDGNVTRTIPVSQLQDKFVDVSVIEKVESIRKELAKLLLSEVEKGSILSVQFLLKTYPDIINCQSRYNGRNSTALSVACQKGNVEMVKLLLTHKASVDIADEEDKEEDCDESDEDEDETNKKGKKPIHHAAVRNYPEVLRLLLQNGSSSIEINGYKRTPLHLAAMKGHVECVRVLLEDEQCDLAIQDSKRKTAFRLAVKSSVQSLELFNLFLATGKWNNTFAERWFLHFATENNNFGAMKVLLSCPEGKKLIRGCDGLDRTPLFIACKNGHNQIAKLLVSNVDKDENGKPWGIDTPNKEKETPLMRVVKKFNYELIEILIGSGANLQATNDDGHTPFHYAASLYKEKKRHPNWPNQETAPAIFKVNIDQQHLQ